MLQPIAYECLAGPSGLALSNDEAHLYVAETCMNRIVRYTQRPAGVWHASVFFQFSGGFGPSSVVVDKVSGYLYVGRYDFGSAAGSAGSVAVIEPSGKLYTEFPVDVGSEVTGVAIGGADNPFLYIAEASSGKVVSMALS